MDRNKKIDAIFIIIIISSALTYSIMCTVRYSEKNFPPVIPIDKDKLTFMTYNIHFGIGMDDLVNLERIAQNIESKKPDILGLQEVELGRSTSGGPDMVFWLAKRLGMPFFYYEPAVNGEAFGVAILSKYSWDSIEGEILPSLSLERPLVHAKFTLNNDNSLHVYATHIGFDDENTTLQIEIVLSRITEYESEETVLMGDFNFNPTVPDYQSIIKYFNDTCADLGNIDGTFPSYPEPEYLNRIDYIFLNSSTATVDDANRIDNFDGSSTRNAAEYGSDHLPVYATINFT